MQETNYQNKRHPKIREFISKLILFAADLFVILISLFVVFSIESLVLENEIVFTNIIHSCARIYPLYIIISCIFFYEKIYTHRFDFWHESRKIIKSLMLSFITIISFAVFINQSENYPIAVIFYSFVLIGILIPLFKFYLKKKLFKLGYWKKGVKLLSSNAHLASEIFGNPYLGYIKSKRKETDLVFIDSYKKDPEKLKLILEREIQSKRSVLFIPVFNNYQFTNSDIYELTNTRTNLIVLENKLKSNYKYLLKINVIISSKAS